jgi:putative ABC transport system substrate-binding protein
VAGLKHNKKVSVNRKIFSQVLLFIIGISMLSGNAIAFDILILKSANIAPYNDAEKGFRSQVSARIRTIVIDKSLEEETTSLAKRLDEYPADLLYAIGEKALLLSKQYLNKVPVVFSYVFDPESILGNDIGGGIAGVRMTIPPEQQLRIFKQAIPSAEKIGIVYDPQKTQSLVDRADAISHELGIRIISRPINSPKEVVEAIESLKGEVDAILMLPDTTFINASTVRFLLLFSFRNKIPLIGLSEKHVKKGAFMGLAFENISMGEQSGRLAMRIAKGDRHGLTIEEPITLNIVLNMNTAEKLNLNISESFVKRVDIEYN